MAFAETTKVCVGQTKLDIEKLVQKYKAERFAIMTEKAAAMVAFRLNGRNILFKISIPDHAQRERTRWRALLLVIKAKLESVDAGIETFEDAFLANVVMPNGQTVGEYAKPVIENHYSGETHVPLLPNFS